MKFICAHPRPRTEETLATQTVELVPTTFAALDEAERCRREACAKINKDPQRFAELVGQPSGWCVVTEKGFWKRSFHGPHERDLLRERLESGHKVVLTVGIVADPRVSMTSDNHVAEVRVEESCKLPFDKLAVITAQAKIHATSSFYR
jgi:preprotein translocase subunit YajC